MANFVKSLLGRSKAVLRLGEPMKMTLVVRTDLKMTTGKIGSQCAHAAVICYTQALKKNPEYLNAWLNLGQPKIVLRVPCEEDLNNLILLANDKNIVNGSVHDAGKTQVKAGTLTVIGIGPDTAENIDAITKTLKTL